MKHFSQTQVPVPSKSATVKPRPTADCTGMKISVLPPAQLAFTVE